MKSFKYIAVLLAATSVAAYEPEQRRRSEASEQAAERGTVTRQGKYWVEEISGNATATPRVRIESPGGSIDLRGGAQQDITYRIVKKVSTGSEESARRLLADSPVIVRRHADWVEIVVRPGRHSGFHANFEVVVPKSTVATDLETKGGPIAARDLDGALRAQTAGGNIDVDRIGGASELKTAGGGITMKTINGRVDAQTAGGHVKLGYGGGDAHLATAGGNIEIGKVEGSVRAETAGGNVTIGSAGGDVGAQTAGGTITIGEAGKVRAVTAGGSIHVDAARDLMAQTAGGSIRLLKCAGSVRAETAAGSIVATIVTVPRSWAESLLETSGGDIVVYLPQDLAVTIRAAIEQAAARHRISSDFPLTVRSTETPGPREIIGEGKLNGGGAALRLRTVSGNIEIRKKP